jgi:hypothetical protein
LKIKLNGCHFDTIEVMEAESQAVAEHPHRTSTFRMCIKMTEELRMVHMRRKGTTWKEMVASRPKVSF